MPPTAKWEGPACGRAERSASDSRHGENLHIPERPLKNFNDFFHSGATGTFDQDCGVRKLIVRKP